jgi:two-component system chemotaxis response regulator CheY
VEKKSMPHALVVDDAKVVRLLLADSLSDLGFHVHAAADGRQALDVLTRMPQADLVLVDWNMPVMNGLDFLKQVRANPAFTSLPVVMVTSETDVQHIVRALEAGANDYIMKPFTTEMIAEKLLLLGLTEVQQL